MNVRRKKAFTIIELIVVIAVIGILVLLAMPKLLNYVEKSKVTVIRHDIKVAENKMSEMLMHGDKEFINENKESDWFLTDKTEEDFKTLVDERKLYNVRGLVEDYIKWEEYKIIPQSMRLEIGTNLTGEFYANAGGKVYYERDKSGVAEPDGKDENIGTNGCPLDTYVGYMPINLNDVGFLASLQVKRTDFGDVTVLDIIKKREQDVIEGKQFTEIDVSAFKKDDKYFILMDITTDDFEDENTGDNYRVTFRKFGNTEYSIDLFNEDAEDDYLYAWLEIRKNNKLQSAEEIEDYFGRDFEHYIKPFGNLMPPKYVPIYNNDTILNCITIDKPYGGEVEAVSCPTTGHIPIDFPNGWEYDELLNKYLYNNEIKKMTIYKDDYILVEKYAEYLIQGSLNKFGANRFGMINVFNLNNSESYRNIEKALFFGKVSDYIDYEHGELFNDSNSDYYLRTERSKYGELYDFELISKISLPEHYATYTFEGKVKECIKLKDYNFNKEHLEFVINKASELLPDDYMDFTEVSGALENAINVKNDGSAIEIHEAALRLASALGKLEI